MLLLPCTGFTFTKRFYHIVTTLLPRDSFAGMSMNLVPPNVFATRNDFTKTL